MISIYMRLVCWEASQNALGQNTLGLKSNFMCVPAVLMLMFVPFHYCYTIIYYEQVSSDHE